jgi:hypothetical protein
MDFTKAERPDANFKLAHDRRQDFQHSVRLAVSYLLTQPFGSRRMPASHPQSGFSSW